MGAFSPSYNYKSTYDIDPKSRKYLDELAAYNPADYIKTNLGKAGRQSREILDMIKEGKDVSQYMGPELAAIKGEAARDKEIAGRRIAGTLAYANQPGIAAAQQEAAMRARDQDTGLQVAQAARDIRSEALQTFLQAKAQQQAARQAIAQYELAKRQAANEAYLQSFRQATGGSFLGGLLKGGIGAAATAFGGPAGAAAAKSIFG